VQDVVGDQRGGKSEDQQESEETEADESGPVLFEAEPEELPRSAALNCAGYLNFGISPGLGLNQIMSSLSH